MGLGHGEEAGGGSAVLGPTMDHEARLQTMEEQRARPRGFLRKRKRSRRIRETLPTHTLTHIHT